MFSTSERNDIYSSDYFAIAWSVLKDCVNFIWSCRWGYYRSPTYKVACKLSWAPSAVVLFRDHWPYMSFIQSWLVKRSFVTVLLIPYIYREHDQIHATHCYVSNSNFKQTKYQVAEYNLSKPSLPRSQEDHLYIYIYICKAYLIHPTVHTSTQFDR